MQVFFQLERETLLQSQEDGLSNGAYTVKKILDQERQVEPPEKVALRPFQYQHLILPSDWYVVGSKYTGKGDPNSYRRDRKHRKTHGVISFVELTKLVSRKWKVADSETKEYCRNLAQGELLRYRKELDEFIKIYGADAAKGKKRKPRKSKANQLVQPQKPEEPTQMAKPDQFDGECAFIPIDDDVDHEDISIDPIQSSKREGTLSNATRSDFESSLAEDICAEFYAPCRLNEQSSEITTLSGEPLMQDQSQCSMYSITPCTQGNHKVSKQDALNTSLTIPFNASNSGYSDVAGMEPPAQGNFASFQGRAVHGYCADSRADQTYARGHSYCTETSNYFGQFGTGQGDQYTTRYKQDVSTQKQECDMQQHFHSQHQQQRQRPEAITSYVEQLYVSPLHDVCQVNGRRVSMESVRRSNLDVCRRNSTDSAFSQSNMGNMMNATHRRSTMDSAFSQNDSSNMTGALHRRSSMDSALSHSPSSSMMVANSRRSSLPMEPKIDQTPTGIPRLSFQQEQLLKNLAEEEKLLRTLGDNTFGKIPLADRPTTNYPSAA